MSVKFGLNRVLHQRFRVFGLPLLFYLAGNHCQTFPLCLHKIWKGEAVM